MKSLNSFLLLPLVCVLCLFTSAKADTIATYSLSGTFANGYTLGGGYVLDLTTGQFVSVDFKVNGDHGDEITDLNDFFGAFTTGASTTFASDKEFSHGHTLLDFGGPFGFPTHGTVPLTQGDYDTTYGDIFADPTGQFAYNVQTTLVSGSIREVTATPEPSSLTLISTAMLVICGFFFRSQRQQLDA